MKKMKFLSLILVGILSVGLLAGCNKTPAEPNVTDVPTVKEDPVVDVEGEGVTLNTVSMFGGNDPSASSYQELIKEYEESTGNSVSDASDSSDDAWKATVVTDFGTGNEPDVLFYFNGADASEFIDKVVSVDTIRAEFPDYAKDISDSVLDVMAEKDGTTYAVPVKGFYEALFVNKDMFDERNLELPTDWDKLTKAIEVFVAEGITPFSISFAEEPHYLIETLILSAGGVDEHKVSPTNNISSVPESWITGLDTINVLAEMGAFPIDAATRKSDTAQEDFYNGVSPLFIDGSWRVSGINDRGIGDSVVAIAFPQIPNGKGDGTEVIAGFSTGFYITKKAWEDPDKKQAAVDFINVMTSKDGVKRLLGEGAGAPAAEIESGGNETLAVKSGVEMMNNANGVDMPVDSRLKAAAWEEITINIPNIADGSMTAKEVLELAIPQNK